MAQTIDEAAFRRLVAEVEALKADVEALKARRRSPPDPPEAREFLPNKYTRRSRL